MKCAQNESQSRSINLLFWIHVSVEIYDNQLRFLLNKIINGKYKKFKQVIGVHSRTVFFTFV